MKLITVEPVMFFYQLVVFTQFGVMQDLIMQKVCLHSEYRNSCHHLSNDSMEYVQTAGSHWIRYCNIATFIPATISAIYMGSWCSTFGAKGVMILTTVGAIISNITNVAVSVYMETDVSYILIGQFFGGLLGGGIGLTMSVMSYVSVISSLESRTMRIGFLTAMLSAGATVGPFLGGYMLEATNHAYVFLFLLSVNVLTLIYILIRIKNVVPAPAVQPPLANEREGLPPSDIAPSITCKNLFSLKHFKATLTTCFRKREHNERKYIILLLLSMALYFFGVGGEADVTYLFLKDEPLLWKYSTYSYFSGMNQALRSVTLLFLMPWLKMRFEILDTTTGLLGIMSCILSAGFLGLSNTTEMAFCVPLISALQGFFVASMRSLLTKLLSKNEHGQMFALVAVMENFCYLMASTVFNSLYPVTRNFFHGFVFILVALLEICPMITVICLRRPLRPFSTRRESSFDYATFKQDQD